MRDKLIKNVFFSLLEKAGLIGGQFLSSILLIRLLKRADYGVIGTVAGIYTFIYIFNLSIEAIVFRDHALYKENLNKVFYNFFIFNLLKSLLFIFIGYLLAILLSQSYQDKNFVFAIISITSIFITETLISPFVIYASSQFKQKIVTKISLYRSTLNLFLLLGLLYFPSIKFIAMKDMLLGSIIVITWYIIFNKKFNINIFQINLIKDIDLKFITNSLFSFSIWSHLSSLVTNFIYRSDTFFLSLFTNMTIVGNYNIALNSANIANILPMILGYQNNVALSNCEDKKSAMEISNVFIRISFYLGMITIFSFILLGKIYLQIITGQEDVSDIYTYMLLIMISLVIIKTIASPLVSFINMKGDIKRLFFAVFLPIGAITFICYFFSGMFYGGTGLAITNILVSVIWLIFLFLEIKKYHYNFSGVFDFKTDLIFCKKCFHNWISRKK